MLPVHRSSIVENHKRLPNLANTTTTSPAYFHKQMLHARKAWKGWAFCQTDNIKKSRVLNSEAALFTFVFTLVHPCLSFFTLSIWCWSHEHVQGSSTPLTCDLPLPPGLFEAILTPPCPKFGYSSFYMACSCWLWFWLIHRLWCPV